MVKKEGRTSHNTQLKFSFVLCNVQRLRSASAVVCCVRLGSTPAFRGRGQYGIMALAEAWSLEFESAAVKHLWMSVRWCLRVSSGTASHGHWHPDTPRQVVACQFGSGGTTSPCDSALVSHGCHWRVKKKQWQKHNKLLYLSVLHIIVP